MNDKKQRLETAARAAVQQAGFNRLSFRTLADTVGVKSSSVHYYFPEKTDLARTLIDRYDEDFRRQLALIDERELELGERLDAFVDIFERILDAGHFCLCGMMAAEVADLDDASRSSLARYFRNAERWLVDTLEQQPERLAAGVTPTQLASLLVAGLEGALLLDRVSGGGERLQAQRALVQTLVR